MLEHALPAQIREVEIQQAVVHYAQEDQHSPAVEDLAVDASPAEAPFLLSGQGEGIADSGYEKEEWENGVVVTHPFPVHVAHLGGEPGIFPSGEKSADFAYYGGKSEYEHHVQTSQRVEGHKSVFVFHKV